MIALVALLAVAQPCSVDFATVPAASTSTSTAMRFVTMSELTVNRIKAITSEAIAQAQHCKIDLRQCRADKFDGDQQLGACRTEKNKLRVDLVERPRPASPEASGWDTTKTAITIVAAALAAAAGATACAALHCNL